MRSILKLARLSSLALLALALMISVRSVAAEQPRVPGISPVSAGTETEAEFTLSKRVDEVNLVFTVTDSRGHFINNLQLTNLKLLDNHLPPRSVDYFQQQTDLPLRVAILIDVSDSIRERFRFEQQAASTFLKKVVRPGKDQAMVVAFGSEVQLLQDLSDDVNTAATGVNHLKAGGDTALYDAIIFACDKLMHSGGAATRRAVILITDGVDTRSRALMYDAQQAAARAEVVMFALSTNILIGNPYPKGDAVLDVLTTPTGGHILPAREKSDLGYAFRHVEKALRSQYALGYHPADFRSDGSFRSIQILPQRNSLKIQCRKGYFAPREDRENH